MKRVLLSFAACAALTTGCLSQRDYAPSPDEFDSFSDDGYVDEGYDDYGASNINVTNGRVNGDIGAVHNFDSSAQQVDAWYDSSWQSTSITLTANDAGGRMGMFILNVDGVDLRAVHPGTYTYSVQSVDPGLDGGYVTTTGCSSDDASYYDEEGDSGTITVQDTPQGRQIDVDASLPGSDAGGSWNPDAPNTTAHGSFTIQ